jgi:uncharacterized membrane protein YphA (DoxX/SURF4 family)
MRLADDAAVIRSLEIRLRHISDAYAPDPRYLAILRVAFGIWVIAFPVDLRWIADVPPDFFNPPPGLLVALSAPPSEAVLLGLMGTSIVLAILVAAGVCTLPASIALSLSLITSSGIAYSFSKVDHFILFALAPVFLALAGWGRIWSVDAILRRRRGSQTQLVKALPVLLFAITVGWGMLSAAAPKAAGGWLDPARQATRGYVARDVAQGERIGPLGPHLLEIGSGVFWKFLDFATLITEGGLLIAALFPFLFRLWLVLAVGFHAAVYLALGINFSDYLLAYAVFFSPVFVWAAERLHGLRTRERSSKFDPVS